MELILLAIGGYLLALIFLSLIARPYRRKLAKLGNELLSSPTYARDRGFIEHMMESAYSLRSVVVLAAVYFAGLFQSGESLDEECAKFEATHPVFARDARVHQMMDAYFVSVTASSPVFGLMAYLAKWAFRLKARIHHDSQSARKVTDFRGLSVQV